MGVSAMTPRYIHHMFPIYWGCAVLLYIAMGGPLAAFLAWLKWSIAWWLA